MTILEEARTVLDICLDVIFNKLNWIGTVF